MAFFFFFLPLQVLKHLLTPFLSRPNWREDGGVRGCWYQSRQRHSSPSDVSESMAGEAS